MFKSTYITFISFLIFTTLHAQNAPKPLSINTKAALLIEVLTKYHCEPQVIDNAFSQKLFKTYISNLDPEKDILTKEDVFKIKKFEFLLDDQIKSKNIIFVNNVAQIVKARLKKNDSLLVAITDKPINFNSNFTYTQFYDSLATNEAELKSRLQKNLKYSIFNHLYYSLLDTNTLRISDNYLNPENLKSYEKSARELVRDRFRNQLINFIDFKDEKLLEKFENIFLQSIASIYDNHTEYFEKEQAADFMNSMNPESEVFGFSLDENKKGEIILSDLLPGGPAWKCGLINEGDILLNFTYDGEKTVNTVGGDLYEVNNIMDKSKSKNITLSIRKASKEIQIIKLTKETIVLEDQSVKGLIVGKDNNFGYINLPAFYSDYETEEQLGCANDVAKELLKMKEDNIKGLIIDLRYNSGGSVKEALELAGIFIDQGVFGAMKPQKGKSVLLKDPNRGSIYDGPMVVLVNQMSASASEILAAILQDYNRAVIIGSSTFGKGVAQGFFPLDSLEKDPKYYVKATVESVFSPTGRAIQHLGVQPDILLPCILDGAGVNEKNELFSLSPKVLERSLNFNPYSKILLNILKENSAKRIQKNEDFLLIEKMAGMIKTSINNINLPEEYNWNTFCRKQLEANETQKSENNNTKGAFFKIKVPTADKERAKIDQYWNSYNEKLFEQITKDIYINESIEILTNLNK